MKITGHTEKLGALALFIKTANTQIRLGGCAC